MHGHYCLIAKSYGVVKRKTTVKDSPRRAKCCPTPQESPTQKSPPLFFSATKNKFSRNQVSTMPNKNFFIE